MPKKLLFAFALLLCATPLMAQDAPPESSNPPSSTPPSSAPRGRRENLPPCWKEARVGRSVIEQLRSIERDSRSRVLSVCSNTSLAPMHKRQQIRSIHAQGHEKMEGLVTADQRRAFAACRRARGERPGVEWFERPGGGCGSRQGGPSNGAPDDENGTGNPPPTNNSSPQN